MANNNDHVNKAVSAASAAAEAAKIASHVAAEAVTVAKEVALRAASTAADVAAMATKTSEAVLIFSQDIAHIKVDITDIKSRLDTKYVSKEEYMPTKMQCNDHETRIREAEKSLTKTQTFGTIFLIALGIIQFLIGKFVD